MDFDALRDQQEENLLGGFRKIYPGKYPVEKEECYKRYLDAAKELHEFMAFGKKPMQGSNLKIIKEDDANKRDNKPPWRSTGVNSTSVQPRPSKQKPNPGQIKAKINTGLITK